MALERRIVSDYFPYMPLTITVQAVTRTFYALFDSGFDGDAVVPGDYFGPSIAPDRQSRWTLANGSRVFVPTYIGSAQMGELGSLRVEVIALGDEFIVGRGVSDHFTVTLDHGQRLIVEP